MGAKISIIIGLSLSVCLAGCGQESPNAPETRPLIGTWEETFTWRGPYWENEAFERISTLTFSEEGFRVTVFPRNRILVATPDSIYTTWDDDTLYVGTYQHGFDTVTFFVDGLDEAEEFTYRFDPEGLHLTYEGGSYYDPIHQAWVVSLYGPFLWAHSWGGYTGVFTRVD